MKYFFIFLILLFTTNRSQLQSVFKFNEVESFIVVDFFDASTGFVVGSNGELYKSTDSGKTLQNIPVPGNRGITNLGISRNGTVFVCGYQGMVAYSIDRGLTWIDLSLSDYPGQKLSFIQSLSPSTLVITGENGFFAKSEDMGSSWNVLRLGIDNLEKVVFSDYNRGFALKEHGGVLSTTDGGLTWTNYFLPYSGSPIKAAFVLGQNRLFISKDFTIIFSNNGGLTYTSRKLILDNSFAGAMEVEPGRIFGCLERNRDFLIQYAGSAYILDEYNISGNRNYTGMWLKGSRMYLISKGPDLIYGDPGYSNWKSTIVSFADRPPHTIMINSETDWTVSGNAPGEKRGRIARTTNSGNSWFYVYDDKWVGSCYFPGNNTGYRVREKAIDYSSDNGNTWSSMLSLNSGIIISEQSFSRNDGYFISTDTLEKPRQNAFSKLYKRTGGSVNTQINLTGGRLTHLNFISQQNGWVLRDSMQFYVTTNGGTNWILQPQVTPLISSYTRFGSNSGVLVTRSGYIMKSTDNAASWQTVFVDTTLRFNTISSIGANIIAAGDSGCLFVSADSGNTWQKKETGNKFHFTVVKFINSGQFLISTRSGGLYRGDTGGSLVSTDDEKSIFEIPSAFTLGNYPNPFNGSTVIHFTLPEDFNCRLEVFSSLGSLIFSNDIKASKGENRFNFDASGLESGVYFYRVKAGGKVLTGKMLLLK